MLVLGSREQLCVNEEVNSLRGKALSNACQYLCKKRGKLQCNHFNRVPGTYSLPSATYLPTMKQLTVKAMFLLHRVFEA